MAIRSSPRLVLLAVGAIAAFTPGTVSAFPGVLNQPTRYVIITSDALAPSFAPLVDWKNQKGVPALVRTMSQVLAEHPIAADDAERVRMEIQDAYAAGAQWILIGGDAGVMPVRYARTTFFGGETLPTDLYFQCLDGNWNADGDGLWGEGFISASDPGDDADLVPEVWIGRAPVTTPSDVDLFIAKTLQYEKTPVGDYEHRTLCFADVLFPQNWTPGNPNSLDGAELIEENLPTFDLHPGVQVERYYENYMDPSYRSGALEETHAAVVDALSEGRNLVLGVGEVQDPTEISLGQGTGLTSADALALDNGSRLSVWFAPSLWNAFDTVPDPLAEALMRAPLGGAVATMSSSRFGFPTVWRSYQSEFLRLAYADSVKAVGEALSRARLPFVQFSMFDGVHRWTQMTLLLMGDPELQLYTGTPRMLDVDYPMLVFIENGYIDVTVETGGLPLPGALVTAYKPGDFIESHTTDANGFVRIPLPSTIPSQVRLTVTGCDVKPFLGTFDYTFFPLATELALASSDASTDRVRLVWQGGATLPATALVERTADELTWERLAELAPDGNGRFTYEDRAIEPGRRYGYRLAFPDEAGEGHTETSWVEVPERAPFALLGARPNPARGVLSLAFSLPRTDPAQIEVLDLAGRRLAVRDVGAMGAGEHRVAFEGSARWRSGIYLVRLTQGGRTEVQRVALVR